MATFLSRVFNWWGTRRTPLSVSLFSYILVTETFFVKLYLVSWLRRSFTLCWIMDVSSHDIIYKHSYIYIALAIILARQSVHIQMEGHFMTVSRWMENLQFPNVDNLGCLKMPEKTPLSPIIFKFDLFCWRGKSFFECTNPFVCFCSPLWGHVSKIILKCWCPFYCKYEVLLSIYLLHFWKFWGGKCIK